MSEENIKIVHTNRKARFNYEIIDSIEAGIVLTGSEVKSVREGKVNLNDAYGTFRSDELWMISMHISPFDKAAMENPDPRRDRKLLLHKRELKKLKRQVEEKGVTIVPLRVYFKRHLAKVEIGLARGKRKVDKRKTIADRDMKRDMERERKYNQ